MPRDLTDRTPVVALQTFALLANVRPRKSTTPILQYTRIRPKLRPARAMFLGRFLFT
jgi:hypothetical protein